MELSKVPARELAIHSLHSNLSFAGRGGDGALEAGSSNTGKTVDKVQEVWGLHGESYCAMGQYWNLAVALLAESKAWPPSKAKDEVQLVKGCMGFIGDNYLNFSPAVVEMVKQAVEWKQWRTLHSSDDARLIVPGDYVCLNFGTRAKPARHIGQFWKWDGSHMWLVEWNTTPGPGDHVGDPPGAAGCLVKARAADPSFVTGWIAWQG